MNRAILLIYDYFKTHPWQGWSCFIIVTTFLAISLSTLSYKEDIFDFLPLDESDNIAMSVYRDVSGADNIIVTVSARDTATFDIEEIIAGLETFAGTVEQSDSLGCIKSMIKEVDMERIMELTDYIYSNIPYFLTVDDYARIDSLMAIPGYVEQQLEEDKTMLQFPSSSLLTTGISRDPLNLFSPIFSRIRQRSADIEYETYDGYILTPDGMRAVILIESRFGAHESDNNALLLEMLEEAGALTEAQHANIDIHVFGSPAIAVTNANRIKSDSLIAIGVAGILILSLLVYVYRSARNILLMVVSVGWGWLFAMGCIAMVCDSVSIIVVGIASVIVGIAMNYPLHLTGHLQDSMHVRTSLKQIITPLVIGNITTVGAFLCLVPLDSVALHDLGLYSSLLLVGTIIFVLIFLPHAIRFRRVGNGSDGSPYLLSRIADARIDKSRWVLCIVLILTVIFGYFSVKTEFDSDLRNINYMTPGQRADIEYFAGMGNGGHESEKVYVVSSGRSWNEALVQNGLVAPVIRGLVEKRMVECKDDVSSFLASETEQVERLDRWNGFVAKYRARLCDEVVVKGVASGFNTEAFKAFVTLLDGEYEPREFGSFEPIAASVFRQNISEDSLTGRKSIVQILEVSPRDIEHVKATIGNADGFNGLTFDVVGMNSSVTETLSSNFNYIGIVCGAIVFIFLWISFGSIELAIVSFLPMAVSWIWILGIMGMFDIRFNIVNIILATFIFGQGDDYTIFITEGLAYEYAYRRRLLASYKTGIIVSALIMFIGIGSLIFAQHPAMRSLGEITVVGMLSVVLMAYFFPPLVFNWLVRKKDKVRYRPITLGTIISTGVFFIMLYTLMTVSWVWGVCLFVLTEPTPRKKRYYHCFVCTLARLCIRIIPGVKFRFDRAGGDIFSKPVIVVSHQRSGFDTICLMAISPGIVLVLDYPVGKYSITGRVFRWLGFIDTPLTEDRAVILHALIARGYSIVPVILNGIHQVAPDDSNWLHTGEVLIKVCPKVQAETIPFICRPGESSNMLMAEEVRVNQSQASISQISKVVYDKFRYKGAQIQHAARKNIKKILKQSHLLQDHHDIVSFLVYDESGQGELALMLALMYPYSEIYTVVRDEDSKRLLECTIPDFAPNVKVVGADELTDTVIDRSRVFRVVGKNKPAVEAELHHWYIYI